MEEVSGGHAAMFGDDNAPSWRLNQTLYTQHNGTQPE